MSLVRHGHFSSLGKLRNTLTFCASGHVLLPLSRFMIAYDISHAFRIARLGSHLQHDFAWSVACGALLERFASAGQRNHLRYNRLQLPGIHQRGDLLQLPPISADNEKYPAHAVLLGRTRRNRGNQCHQYTARN